MPQNTTEFDVDGIKYSSTKYAASRGLKLSVRLLKLIGKPAGILAPVFSNKESLKDLLASDLDMNVIGEAIGALVGQLDADDVVDLARELLATTQIIADGKYRDVNFDLDFAGNYGSLLKLLQKVVEFQFASFFAGGLAGVKDMLRQASPIHAR